MFFCQEVLLSGKCTVWFLVRFVLLNLSFFVLFMFCKSLFVLFLLTNVLSVLLQFLDSDYPFGIFNLFL